MKVNTHLPGNKGFRPADEKVYLEATAAVTKGTIYTLDMSTATAANYGIATDHAGSVLGTKEDEIFVLALEDLASGETGEFLLTGYADIIGGAGGLAALAAFTSAANGTAITAAVGYKTLGYAPEAIGAGSTGKAWFDGMGLTQTVSVID